MIRFGLPSKGRLKKQVEKFFSERGLELVNAGMTREYLAEFKGEKKVQIITDHHIKSVDDKVSSKEKEIMTI